MWEGVDVTTDSAKSIVVEGLLRQKGWIKTAAIEWGGGTHEPFSNGRLYRKR